jgi:mono/diheme cytochrome c family protein
MFCILTLLFAMMIVSCSNESKRRTDVPVHTEDFSLREGKRLFVHYCSACHGEKGDGFGKYFGYALEPQPTDLTAPDFLLHRSDSLLTVAITGGSAALGKSNLCPPWGNTLRGAEVGYLVKFVKKINEQANVDDTADKDSGGEG